MDASRHKGKMERLAAALILLIVPVNSQGSFGFAEEANAGSPCYLPLEDGTDDLSRPQRCMPPFKNVVAQKPVTVSPVEMTCGMRSGVQDKYCIQTGGYYRECDICDAFDNTKSHNATSLTDIHTDLNQTWWQSVTMREGVHTTEVNLTVHLNKAYDITYVRLKFHSPRPESFAIYKKNRREPTEEDMYPNGGGPEDWVPWQYYSATCRDTYSVEDALSIIQPRDGTEVSEDRALCNSEYSDISPLTGGNVAFSTLEGRPSAYYFDESRELQHWVSATDIKISLRRLNTFGDEVFGDYKVLQSYYYAITHFTVGGRCQCNGHSNVCIPKSGMQVGEEHMICLCKHGTDGANCETCLPDHNDMPWRRATSENANACKPCECNGWATRCQFNEELLARTGRGGECLECQGNRAGPQCERCKDDHFISPHKDNQGRQECLPCECDPNGSTSLQCSLDGKCPCKEGVMGDKCDKCMPNYFKFPEAVDNGCTTCECNIAGSSNNSPRCDVVSGVCDCKENVEGRRCDMCRSGHFHIDSGNEFGCTPCFCFDHTADCEVARGYTKARIESDFSRGSDEWTAEEGVDQLPIRYNDISKLISVQSHAGGGQGAYFLAPKQYLGDQRKSYNQLLKFRLKIGPSQSGVVPSREDIIIEGQGVDRVTTITLMLTAQGNPTPSYQLQDYAFRLHESKDWSPSLTSKAFMAVLANIKSIKIRGTYVIDGMGFLDEVQLETAETRGNGAPATWIERCRCPQGYQGQYCEFCQPGYYHENSGVPSLSVFPATATITQILATKKQGSVHVKTTLMEPIASCVPVDSMVRRQMGARATLALVLKAEHAWKSLEIRVVLFVRSAQRAGLEQDVNFATTATMETHLDKTEKSENARNANVTTMLMSMLSVTATGTPESVYDASLTAPDGTAKNSKQDSTETLWPYTRQDRNRIANLATATPREPTPTRTQLILHSNVTTEPEDATASRMLSELTAIDARMGTSILTASRAVIPVIATLRDHSMEHAMFSRGNATVGPESLDNDAISVSQITMTFRWTVARHATATPVDQQTFSVTL